MGQSSCRVQLCRFASLGETFKHQLEVKKSKFISAAGPVQNVQEVCDMDGVQPICCGISWITSGFRVHLMPCSHCLHDTVAKLRHETFEGFWGSIILFGEQLLPQTLNKNLVTICAFKSPWTHTQMLHSIPCHNTSCSIPKSSVPARKLQRCSRIMSNEGPECSYLQPCMSQYLSACLL